MTIERVRITAAGLARLNGTTALTPPAAATRPAYRARATDSFKLSEQQQALFDWVREGSGSALLEAVAGAGKTTTLIRALAIMNGSIFFGAYNKKISEEIKAKAEAARVTRPGIYISTMHGVGFASWIERNPKVTVDDRKVANLVKDAAEKDPRYAQASTFICRMVSFGKQFLIGCKDKPQVGARPVWEKLMAHFGVEQDLPEDADMDFAWEAVMTIYSESIKTCGKIIDFDDQIFAPLMFNCRFFRNDWVLIDECQDINPARRELAKRLLKPTGRLLAVGDSRQAIYGFTGAGGDSVEKIIEEFGCARLPLTVTYRCPKAVVSYVHQWVDHIQAHEDAPEGVVRDVAFSPDPKPCRACLGTGISLGHVKTCSACDGAKLSPAEPWFQQDAPGAKDVILCRYTAPLIRNAFAMLRAGVACKVEGRDIGNNLIALASQWKVKSLDALQKRVEQWQVAQVAKAQAKNSERQEQDINDRVATLMVFIERCREKGVHTVEGLIVEIKSIFADNVKGVMTLSTIHKAKGREWPRVYWLQGPIRGRNLQEWEMAQELNMKYVAGTRAQAELILVPEAL